LGFSITCEERREEGRRGGGGGVVVLKEGGGTNGLTFGTPAYRHGLLPVVHVGAIIGTTGSIPRERTTVKGHGAAATEVNINCPSIGSSIVDECDDDQDDVGVGHIQPSTTTSISIFYDEV